MFLVQKSRFHHHISSIHTIHLRQLSFLLFLILLLSSSFCTHVSRRGVPISVTILFAPETSLRGDDLFHFVWWSAHAEKKPGGSPHSNMLGEMTKARRHIWSLQWRLASTEKGYARRHVSIESKTSHVHEAAEYIDSRHSIKHGIQMQCQFVYHVHKSP